MYLRESQQQRSRQQEERRAHSRVARTGMSPVPPLADAGYANSLGVEYFCLVADRDHGGSEPPATVVTKG